MAIIVEHTETQTLYVVVGTGYALGPRSRDDAYPLVACADTEGQIRWFYSSQLTVELVDGRAPDDLLLEAEGIVYEHTPKRVPAPAPPQRAGREEQVIATSTIGAEPARSIEEPSVDPKDVVATSAELWKDTRPL